MANTSAPLSEAGIASSAAGILDDYTVMSLDDNTPIGRFMCREFGMCRREILEAHPWHIAKTRSLLTALVDKPAFDWDYQYQLPEGCLRVLPPSYDGTWNRPPIPHEVESGRLLCNVGPTLPVKWIRDETDVSKWTALMARAMAGKMAMYAASRVTGKLAFFEKARAAYIDGMTEAKFIDGLCRGTTEQYYDTAFDGYDSISVRGVGVQ